VDLDRKHLTDLLTGERERFAETHPESARAYAEGREHLFGGVPMTWMNKAAGRFPLYLSGARGSRVTDIDGHEYVDLSLGDTGAMAGHSPPEVVAAIRRRIEDEGGITAMMPTENAAWVGGELARRFGVEQWSFTLTATDANRWAIRLARAVTRRPKILVYAWCYHGSVDESFALPGPDGEAVAR
jgi:glutamate-1-semialdehyde 2,1-aminomutase